MSCLVPFCPFSRKLWKGTENIFGFFYSSMHNFDSIVISVYYNVINANSNKFSNYSSCFIMLQSGHGFKSSFDFSSYVHHAFICTVPSLLLFELKNFWVALSKTKLWFSEAKALLIKFTNCSPSISCLSLLIINSVFGPFWDQSSFRIIRNLEILLSFLSPLPQ